jgi:signal peptidase I
MGDNRNASQDSRVFGPIDDDTVVGRAFVVLWPPSRWSGL